MAEERVIPTPKAQMLIEVEEKGGTYRFYMPLGVPLGECYSAAFKVLQSVMNELEKAVKKSDPARGEKKTEDSDEEVVEAEKVN